jgi:hypothetical protein
MDRMTRSIVGGAIALVVLGAGTGFAIASSGDGDQPLAGSDLDKATAAALASTGGGTVIESEAGDDGSAYEVEIRLEDGRVVEVALDKGFHVMGSGGDHEGTADHEADGAADQDTEGT